MSEHIKHHTIVISDIHLNSPLLNADSLNNFLKNIEFQNLIINGDLFEDAKYLFRLKKSHWKILTRLRKLAKKRNIIWTIGNHDRLGIKQVSDLKYIGNIFGIKVKRELFLEINGIKMVMFHGDKFDGYLYKHPILNDIVTWAYDRLKEIKFEWSKVIVRYIKRRSKILMRNNNFVMEGAFKYAEETNSSVVICGHTHFAELIKKENLIYANCGAFENSIPTFVGIDEDKIGLYQWENENVTLIRELPFFIHN